PKALRVYAHDQDSFFCFKLSQAKKIPTSSPWQPDWPGFNRAEIETTPREVAMGKMGYKENRVEKSGKDPDPTACAHPDRLLCLPPGTPDGEPDEMLEIPTKKSDNERRKEERRRKRELEHYPSPIRKVTRELRLPGLRDIWWWWNAPPAH
uniref:Heparan-sulfate 6-O-sulfotransferase n=1 Tax=Macrostomum lignano TaxID=282301 RepID=A0A1I8I1M9_9PLAT